MKPSSPLPSAPTAVPNAQVADALRHLSETWQGAKSRLTPTGAPYEWVFTSYASQPRLTYEVAPPGTPFAGRWATAVSLLPHANPEYLDTIRWLAESSTEQESLPVWLGARGDGLHRLKLYVGVARVAAAHAWAERFIGKGTLISACAHRLRLIGYEPESGHLEFYYRLDGFEAWHIPLLMWRFEEGAEAEPLLDVLATLIQRRLDENLPRRMAFSISVQQDGTVSALALHWLANVLIGRDVTVRARLLALAEARGWASAAYAAYTAPLVPLHPVNPFHNFLSVAVRSDGEVDLGIGVAPLEASGVVST